VLRQLQTTTANRTEGKPQLSLTLGCTPTGKTVLKQRYMSYPLSVSPIFRLDEQHVQSTVDSDRTTAAPHTDKAHHTGRAYLYRMNTSPGLLAGDRLNMALTLENNSSLLLADQAATKVHTMPTNGPTERRTARVNYSIEVGDRATLEFFPEPLILFTDAALQQTTNIRMHPSAGLSWGEIVLPGRLARGERYQFQTYWSRLQISASGVETVSKQEQSEKRASPAKERTLFVENMKLLGKNNPFAQNDLFANTSVLGSLILVLPEAIATEKNLSALAQQIDQLSRPNDLTNDLTLASSVLPSGNGLFVRAIAQTTRDLQAAFKAAANSVRQLRKHPPLPYSL